jgi:hypothetical protein
MNKIWKTLALHLAIIWLAPMLAYAEEPRIKEVVIITEDQYLAARIELENSFSANIADAISKGIPIRFFYMINLDQVRDFWLDERIVEIELINTLKYNNLRKEYTIECSWKNDNKNITKSYAEAMHLMNNIPAYKISSLHHLELDKKYQLRVKAKLKRRISHPILQYLLFLFPGWNAETEWYIIDFTY